MNYFAALFITVTVVLLGACGTTDGSLREQGKTESYIQGFHDGRHSGMKEEGNNYEQYIRDEARFVGDPDYKSGWLAGELEGKALQDQAASIGNAAAGSYSGSQIDREARGDTDADKAARDALKGIDTTGLKNLEK